MIKRFLLTALILSLAFNIVNASGIFVEKEQVPIKYGKYQNMITEIRNQFEETTSTLDYLKAGGYALVYGIRIILQFTLDLFTAYDDIFRAFHVPEPYASLFGNTINVILLIGIGFLFRR